MNFQQISDIENMDTSVLFDNGEIPSQATFACNESPSEVIQKAKQRFIATLTEANSALKFNEITGESFVHFDGKVMPLNQNALLMFLEFPDRIKILLLQMTPVAESNDTVH